MSFLLLEDGVEFHEKSQIFRNSTRSSQQCKYSRTFTSAHVPERTLQHHSALMKEYIACTELN